MMWSELNSSHSNSQLSNRGDTSAFKVLPFCSSSAESGLRSWDGEVEFSAHVHTLFGSDSVCLTTREKELPFSQTRSEAAPGFCETGHACLEHVNDLQAAHLTAAGIFQKLRDSDSRGGRGHRLTCDMAEGPGDSLFCFCVVVKAEIPKNQCKKCNRNIRKM